MSDPNKPANPWDPNQPNDPWSTGSTPAENTGSSPAPQNPWGQPDQDRTSGDALDQASSTEPAEPQASDPLAPNPVTQDDPWTTPAQPAASDPWGQQPASSTPGQGTNVWGTSTEQAAQQPATDPWGTQSSPADQADPYAQTSAPQGQAPSDPYGQAHPYGQPASPYGQPQASPYGQPADAYGQAPANPYGSAQAPQADNPWTQPAGAAPVGYGQADPNAVWGNQPGYYATNAPVLAGIGKRFQGWLIDWLIPTIVFSAIFGSIFEPQVMDLGDGQSIESPSRIASLLTFLCTATLLAFLNKNGQTPGRRWAKTQLVNEQGQPLQAGMPSLPRYLAHFLDDLCFLGWLWPAWDKNRQTFGDKVAKTRVIDLQASGIDPDQPRM